VAFGVVNPVSRRGAVALRAVVLAVVAALHLHAALASTEILDYDVVHPWLGKIGTYENAVRREGDGVTVTSRLRVVASIVGIVVHREYADRTELWRDGRIIAFSGMTTINGKPFPVRGQANGSAFIVTSPGGTVTAPADVTPNNPWSCDFIHGTSVFAVNTGTVEPVSVTGGQPAAITIAGRPLWTRQYRIESARTHAQVWLSQTCVPVRMDVVNAGANISLVLNRETDIP
jgi:Family of unknown function (DUF6134)